MMLFPKVKEQPIFLSSLLRSHSVVDGYKAITNPETGKTFSIVSSDYILTPHEQMIETVHDVLKQCPEYGEPTERIELFDDGSKMRASFVFKDIEATIGGRADKINPQIEIFNSYDTGWARKIFFGAYRLVCTNGLVIGEKSFAYRTRHDTMFSQDAVKQTLIMSMEQFSDQQRIWETWVDKVTMPTQYETVMETLPLSKKDVEAINEEVEVSSGLRIDDMKMKTLSVWLFFNIICQYVTHKMGSHLKRAAVESAMRRAFTF